MKRGCLVFVVLILLVGSVLAAEVEEKIEQELNAHDDVPVIVFLKEESARPALGIAMEREGLELRREKVEKVQDGVLGNLKGKAKGLEGKTKGLMVADEEEFDFEVDKKFAVISGFSGKVTAAGLKKLKGDSRVEKVVYDYPIVPQLSGSIPVINADDVWNLSIGGVAINGSGESVCVIDTGVDYTHPALGNCTNETFLAGNCSKVIGGYDHSQNDPDPFPGGTYSEGSRNHGTHVAGIVASTDSTYKGVAPGAKIVAMKVFNDSGVGATSWAISAIDWCVNNASVYNISVITMSIGVTDGGGQEIPYLDYCDANDSLAAKASWAAGQGIFVTASAGNNKGTAGITAPACGENVTSVGSVTKADAISGYNTAPILQVLGIGSSITSTVFSGGFAVKSGTSMAAPHVAGAGALLYQYWREAYNQTPTAFQVRNKLKWTGVGVNDTRIGIVFPRIDVLAAVRPFINFTADNPTNNSVIVVDNALINVSADVNLSVALLEWNNGTAINYTMNGSGTNFYYNMTNISSGTYTYKVYGNDSAGTFGVSEVWTIEMDASSPNITVSSPVNGSYYKVNFNLNISMSDASTLSVSNYNITNSTGNLTQNNTNSSINATSFVWSELVNVSVLGDDNYSLVVFANDSNGNAATSTVSFIVDTTEPRLFGVNKSPATVYNNDSVVLFVNVTDTNLNSSLVLVEGNWTGSWVNYTMSGNVRFNYTVGAGNLSNQEIVGYKFHAVDQAGNMNSTGVSNFTVQNRAPTGLTITPVNGTVIEVGNSTSFTGNASDVDLDSLTYGWNIDGTTSAGTSASYTTNETGSYVVVLNVTDGYVVNTTNVTIIVNDTTDPETSTISYDSSVHNESEENQSVAVTVFDYSGISELKLYYNSVEQTRNCSSQTNTTWTCAWEWGNLNSGNHSFVLNVTDNFTTTHTTSVTYNFTVVNCSDGIENGDEDGEDCGGSCPSACTVTTNDDDNGGGGGGGGGVALPTPVAEETPVVEEPVVESVEEVTEVVPVADYDLSSGGVTSVKLSKGESKTFSLDGVESHSLLVDEVTESKVTMTISSDPVTFTLKRGDTKEVDIDGDLNEDLTVTLKEIIEGMAELSLEKISKGSIVDAEEMKENLTGGAAGLFSWGKKQKVLVAIVGLIIVLLVFYYTMNNSLVLRKVYKKGGIFSRNEKKQQTLEEKRPNALEMAKKKDQKGQEKKEVTK